MESVEVIPRKGRNPKATTFTRSFCQSIPSLIFGGNQCPSIFWRDMPRTTKRLTRKKAPSNEFPEVSSPSDRETTKPYSKPVPIRVLPSKTEPSQLKSSISTPDESEQKLHLQFVGPTCKPKPILPPTVVSMTLFLTATPS